MSTMQRGRSESFNARFLQFQEVGETFVSPPFLVDIAAANNTAILGPRGSGKTTLLKMLTLPALLSWNDPERDQIASRLDYLAVYIPSSLTWNADYRRFSRGRVAEDVSDLISISLFRHNVLHALLNTWRDAAAPEVKRSRSLNRFFLAIQPEKEAELIRTLSRQWEITPPISSIGGMREAISERLRVLQKANVHAAYVDTKPRDLLERYPFVSAHLLDDCAAFADFLSTTYQTDYKLALCFDEVEIAPDAIANSIIRMPRSIDQRFLVKFSAAPYVGASAMLKEPTAPTQRQDYKFVLLSSFSPKETRRFSEALLSSLAASYGISATPNEIFGASLIDEGGSRPSNLPADRYHSHGAYQRRFEALQKADPSFAKYARERNIDVQDLSKGTENERAALIRKIIWPVLIREEFLYRPEKPISTRRRIRTVAAVSNIYTGAASLFAVCEGNPRQIISLMEPMVRRLQSERSRYDEQHKESMLSEEPAPSRIRWSVRRSLQKALLEKMIAAYFALVATVPITKDYENVGSLVDLISLIGNYFKGSVLGREFNPDPVLSFEVDANLPLAVLELVGRGINIGAFVLADVSKSGESPYRLGEITGLRARLSNIFAPHFRLPLAGGRTIRLSTILRRTSSRIPSQPLLELFGGKI